MNYRNHTTLIVAFILHACSPSVSKPTPDFNTSEVILSFTETDNTSEKTAEIEINGLKATISASSATVSGADITFAHGKKYDIYPWEAYFGTKEVRFSRATGIIYTVVLGGKAIGGYGTRVFEFSSKDKKLLRDYYIEKD